jgi:hypothetical protein
VNVDVVTEIYIARPRAEVAAYAADPDNATSWYENIKSVEWRTPKPLTLGSKLDFVAEFLGRQLAYTYEVKDYVPGERLVMATAGGPLAMETTYIWSDLSPGTQMTLRNRGSSNGFRALVAPVMAPAIRRANRKDLAHLKELLERRGP